MDLHVPRRLPDLATRLHFGRAAREAEPQHLGAQPDDPRLEEEAGERLFIRDNRSVALTPAGVRFRAVRPGGSGGLGGDRAGARRSAARALRGELRVYCSVAASYTVLSDLVRGFREAHPGSAPPPGDRATRPRRSTGSRPGTRTSPLPRCPTRCPGACASARWRSRPCCSSPRRGVRGRCPRAGALRAWARVPMVLTATGLSRRRADAWFRARRVRPTVYAEVSGHEAVISMVRLGCGVGIVPRIVLDRFAQKGEVRVLEAAPPSSRTSWACARTRAGWPRPS